MSRIERDMRVAFPKLEAELHKKVAANLRLALTSKPETFYQRVIAPPIQRWLKQTLDPIQHDAARELAAVTVQFDDLLDERFNASALRLMLAPAAAGVLGIGAIVAAFIMGLTTSTVLFFWTTITVSWPVLGPLLAVGAILLVFGAVKVSHLENALTKTFARQFMPKLRDCLIGDGFQTKGRQCDSIRRQFQDAVERTAHHILSQAKPT